MLIRTHVFSPADIGDICSRVALDLLSNQIQVHIISHFHFLQVDL